MIMDSVSQSKPVNLVLGYANVDIIARMRSIPVEGERLTAERIDTDTGGMAANCACAAAFRGASIVFFGSVGNDAFAELLVRDFKRYGVNIDWLFRDVPRTTKALILVSLSGERAIISEQVGYEATPLRRFLGGFMGRAGIFYLDGYHLGVAADEVRWAKQIGFTTYCDLDGAPDTYAVDEILSLLKFIDIVQWNHKVAEQLFPGEGVVTASQQLATIVPILIHTAGSEAITVTTSEGLQAFEVPRVDEVIDTTGAGDVFAGTFIHSYSSGKGVAEAVAEAVRIASRSTRYAGARGVFAPEL
jgi:ribokinase